MGCAEGGVMEPRWTLRMGRPAKGRRAGNTHLYYLKLPFR